MSNARQSNIELFRIVAMFMILVIHANMISLPLPTYAELISNPLSTTIKCLIESIAIVGVNSFVLISGWFLIHTRTKSFLSLFFQIITLWGGTFLVLLLLGKTELSIHKLLDIIAFTQWDWFIKAYIVLLILAPVLNTFIENSSEKTQRYIIVGFFAFSSTYGWLGGANRFFVNGYSPLLFIGLYLLSRYVYISSKNNVTPIRIKKLFILDKKYDFLIFIGCISINTLGSIIMLYSDMNYLKIIAYTNPITIIAALYLLLFFSKIKIQTNKTINYLARSSFAVYLVHSQVDLRPLFNKGVQHLYTSFDGFSCILLIFLYLILVYAISVVIDIPRVWMWNKLSRKYNLK